MMDPEVLKQELDKVNPEEEAEQVQQAGGK